MKRKLKQSNSKKIKWQYKIKVHNYLPCTTIFCNLNVIKMAFIICSYRRLSTKSHFLCKFESQGKVSITPSSLCLGFRVIRKRGRFHLGGKTRAFNFGTKRRRILVEISSMVQFILWWKFLKQINPQLYSFLIQIPAGIRGKKSIPLVQPYSIDERGSLLLSNVNFPRSLKVKVFLAEKSKSFVALTGLNAI